MRCPFTDSYASSSQPLNTNKQWWPDSLKLSILRINSELSNPMSPCFDYAEAFEKLPFYQLKKDLYELISTSQDWWPADYGTYGPFFIRMAWHSAGTYRVTDGRGGSSRGTQRFPPLNSWPDNANLDKARRLLWPIKEKYGNMISWADLFILAGNCSLESMGLKTIGFAGGRKDVWEPQTDVNWGWEKQWLGNDRSRQPGKITGPFGATQMGLIYVNPEGPNGIPNPIESAKNVRLTFKRMAMNDEETVALVAGGHTFGKCHGAAPTSFLGPMPEAAPIEQQNLGWKNNYGTGNADDTITSGIEGAWKPKPFLWDMGYFTVLFKYDWELVKSPAGAWQWLAVNVDEKDMVIDAHDKNVKHRPMMTTADMGMKYDPIYRPIALDLYHNPEKFREIFANAWFKLTHRDLGPVSRYLGPEIPKETFIWQDPVPKASYPIINKYDIERLKNMISDSGLMISELVKTAWASASTYRGSDRRGGANGARIALEPQINWKVNEPHKLLCVLDTYKDIKNRFDSSYKDKCVSLADIIVLGGCVGIEKAAKKAGYCVTVPFIPGRTDALQSQTDIESFDYLEPYADAFRNYVSGHYIDCSTEMMIDKAQLLTLTIPEMTVLIGGMRVIGANYKDTDYGVFTNRKGCLTNDFFTNLLTIDTVWKPLDKDHIIYEGRDRQTGDFRWTATKVDLIFGANAQLRAIAEVYGAKCNEMKFINDFIFAWCKVMNADRFDIDTKQYNNIKQHKA